jgi:hypothetical protein
MWQSLSSWRSRPPLCQACREFARRVQEWRSRRGTGAAWPDHPHDFVSAHGRLAQRANRYHGPEVGVGLYHCQTCDTWWELWEHTYFPSDFRLRRLRVPSVENWQARGRPGMAIDRPRPA